MNKIKTLTRYTSYTLLVAVFISCEPSKQTLENFCGGVVYEKDQLLNGGNVLNILNKDTMKKVYVYDLDYQLYKIGDTINCN